MLPIIQFFGLPGSGKTYLFNILKNVFAGKHYQAMSRSEIVLDGLRLRDDGLLTGLAKKLPAPIWHKIIHEDYCLQELLDYFAKNLSLASFVFRVLQKSQAPQEHVRSIIGAFAATCIECEMAGGDHGERKVLFADEWFHHRFYTLFGNCGLLPTTEQVIEYLNAIPQSEGAIFIATQPSICLARMEQRQRFPRFLSQYSADEIERVLTIGYQGLTALAEQLENTGKSVFVYDGVSSNIEPVVKYCSAAIL